MMKKLMMALLVVMATGQADAQTKNERIDELCGAMGSVSKSVLSGRQRGVAPTLAEGLAMLNAEFKDDGLREMMRSAIIEAYKQPLNPEHMTPEMYSDLVTLECLEVFTTAATGE